MFCTECGKQLADGAKFCSQCGNKVATGAATLLPKDEDGGGLRSRQYERSQSRSSSKANIGGVDYIPLEIYCRKNATSEAEVIRELQEGGLSGRFHNNSWFVEKEQKEGASERSFLKNRSRKYAATSSTIGGAEYIPLEVYCKGTFKSEDEVIREIQEGALSGRFHEGSWFVEHVSEEPRAKASLASDGPKEFEVWSHPALGYEAIKNGWSWPGFFFGWIWAAVKRLWLHSAVLLILMIVLGVLSTGAELAAAECYYDCDGVVGIAIFLNLLFLAIALVVGAKGNSWRRASMPKRGFSLVATVNATSPDAAAANVIRWSKQD